MLFKRVYIIPRVKETATCFVFVLVDRCDKQYIVFSVITNATESRLYTYGLCVCACVCLCGMMKLKIHLNYPKKKKYNNSVR